MNVFKAELLAANIDLARGSRAAVLKALAQGMDWDQLEEVVERERDRDNPVAVAISKLKLDQNTITLRLAMAMSDNDDSDGNDDSNDSNDSSSGYGNEEPKRKNRKTREEKRLDFFEVDLDLDLSVHQNISAYYDTKKAAVEKRNRTQKASSKAIKAAERNTKSKIKLVDMKKVIRAQRKVHWWEKFNWFISSENYLVLSGHNAQQNEQLVKRYLSKNDLYMHADIHGASTTIIKNPTDKEVPPKTLIQAATMTICYSSAWTSKVPASAYWVYANQVSRQAPTGEYLPTGSFMIRGKRNYVMHAPMAMAFALMFRPDEHCERLHAGERRPLRLEEKGAVQKSERQGTYMKGGIMRTYKKTKKEEKDDDDDDEDEEEMKEEKEDKPALSSGVTPAATAPAAATAATAAVELDLDGEDEDEGGDLTSQFLSFGGGGRGSSALLAEEANVGVKSNPGLVSTDEMAGDGEDEDEETKEVNKKKGKGGTRHLSRAERRRLKKGHSGESSTGSRDETGRGEKEKHGSAGQKQKGSKEEAKDNTKAPQHVVLPRGKRTKAKRVKEKYKNQDEEDLKIVSELLGLQKPKQRGGNEGSDEVVAEGSEEKGAGGFKAVGEETYQQMKERRAERERRRQMREREEDENDNAPKQKIGMEELDVLTGRPLDPSQVEARRKAMEEKVEEKTCGSDMQSKKEEKKVPDKVQTNNDQDNGKNKEENEGEDEDRTSGYNLLYGVPVCAPYSAVANYKFKVKLIPGKMKKGKACKQAMEIFNRVPNCTAHEKAVMKGMDENKMFQVIIGHSKVVLPVNSRGGPKRGKGGGRRKKK